MPPLTITFRANGKLAIAWVKLIRLLLVLHIIGPDRALRMVQFARHLFFVKVGREGWQRMTEQAK